MNLNLAILSQDKNKIDKAFQEIYEKYHKLIYFISFTNLIDKNDADDVVQETFLAFYDIIQKTNIYNIKAYLVKTAKNKIIKYNKRVQTNQYEDNMTDDRNDYNDLLFDLKQILNNEELTIVLSKELYNMKFKDIAKKINIPTNTAITKYHRALKKVKKYMKGGSNK